MSSRGWRYRLVSLYDGSQLGPYFVTRSEAAEYRAANGGIAYTVWRIVEERVS